VAWDDVAVSALSQSRADAWRRRNCGMVFQDFHLIEQLTPLQNALLPATFSHFASPGPVRQRATALLREFGVPEAARSVTTLSRGERQRVAIARALLMDPAVVLADEPTASLDADTARQIGDTLLGLTGRGRTVIVVSHDAEVIGRAERVIRLEHGRLVSDLGRAVSASAKQGTAP
jgi:putative ABC transport system ATP-binding protein